MKFSAILNGYRDTPDDIGVDETPMLSQWHLFDPAVGKADAEAPDTLPGAKSSYPYQLATINRRHHHTRGKGRPILNIEVGRLSHDLSAGQVGERAGVLRHVGDIMHAIGGLIGEMPRGYYGDSWRDSANDDRTLESDVAEWGLVGMPELAVIGVYGQFDFDWWRKHEPRIANVRAFCAVTGCTPAFFLNMGDASGEGWATLERFATTCRVVRAVCDEIGGEAFLWGWGNHATPWAKPSPYVEIAAGVFA